MKWEGGPTDPQKMHREQQRERRDGIVTSWVSRIKFRGRVTIAEKRAALKGVWKWQGGAMKMGCTEGGHNGRKSENTHKENNRETEKIELGIEFKIRRRMYANEKGNLLWEN